MPESPPAPLLAMRRIRKAFSGVEVLRGVDFTLQAGEVHALVGENGAGKSTLIKVLAGVHRDQSGQILLDGRPVRFSGPRDAENRGIAVIHQELSLVPYLSVAENIFLGREPHNRLGWLDRARMRRAAEQVLREQLGVELDVSQHVAHLPISLQQMVEIAKALSRAARILIMDEPTSALTEADTAHLFVVIRQLRERGVGIVYISHKMDEIYELADQITVLRDGEGVGTARAVELPREQLVQWMVGRQIDQFLTKHHTAPGGELLRVEGLWLREAGGQRWLVQDANLRLRAGEILGLAGLVGSGNSELLGAIFGRYGRLARGAIHVSGQAITHPAPRKALDSGVALLTNDRKTTGLVLPMSVLHNLTLATLERCRRGGVLNAAVERQHGEPFIRRMSLRAPSLGAEVTTLSGGNQQKVVFARWLMTEPRVLLLDEPTRGIDVSAKADIYALLNELTAAGMAIMLITSELPELLALSDRIMVMHRGQIVTELTAAEATQERIMHAAMGSAERTA
ncbi:MAG: sugar ABC transporter ATP-binding protein [Planctomycetes bacterium]|nr:sugar ABC transporter ATP-binding protein [Planctomycetota bacterium]